jgi:outer membrane protein assembly factor BamE (lipoprotein component of BamABCDE complex)
MNKKYFVSCIKVMLIAILVMPLLSCATIKIGQDFDLATYQAKVKRGETTKTQIREWLGAPKSAGIDVAPNDKQYDLWTYYFGEGKLYKMSTAKFKMLQIKFDDKGIVQGYNWSEGK